MARIFSSLAAAALIPLGALGQSSAKCLALKQSLRLENTTILDVAYIAAPTTVSTPGSCQSSAPVTSAPLCRVEFVINTTSTSAVHAEAWLPDTWFGRFLATGNGGFGGCIDYPALDYGASLHFATFGTDNGHDGQTGLPFLNHPEVINDFTFRADPRRGSYREADGPSGGRQGTQAALKFPEDFDGILAGAPATDANHLLGWMGLLTHYIGATNKFFGSAIFLTEWLTGIITEPDICNFRPETLLDPSSSVEEYLLAPVVDGSKLIYPRYSPGAEADPLGGVLFGGSFSSLTADWERYVILNVTDHDFTNFGGELSAFRNRGGKFLTYHGHRDPLISSTNSKRVYDLISKTLKLPTLDDFYRLFFIPGMGHCVGGLGPTSFGQAGPSAVNASSHNILLALVDWVEGGAAPTHYNWLGDEQHYPHAL
ncbi:tannase and feruloyl esterase [Mycena rebaudengoi]|nr:tannase and feruloyl esterase [Mycena rebaudengoi]